MSVFFRALIPAISVLIWPQVLPAQHTPPTDEEVKAFAARATSEAQKGKLVRLPAPILRKLIAKVPDDYGPCDKGEQKKLETYQIILRSGVVGLAIHGRGFCYCSPTGNCSLWIYQRRQGKYRLILETDMVQTFGFLKSRTQGYPDLVTWSHGSATESSAELFRFDGEQYSAQGGWEIEFEYLDENDHVVTPDEPRIRSRFWDRSALPSSKGNRRPN